MIFKFCLSESAYNDLECLDSVVRQKILNKLTFFSIQSNPLKYAKKLINFYFGNYRFRIGDYRIIFDLNKDKTITILLILRVKHRRDAYNL